jgi:hypothetical protein
VSGEEPLGRQPSCPQPDPGLSSPRLERQPVCWMCPAGWSGCWQQADHPTNCSDKPAIEAVCRNACRSYCNVSSLMVAAVQLATGMRVCTQVSNYKSNTSRASQRAIAKYTNRNIVFLKLHMLDVTASAPCLRISLPNLDMRQRLRLMQKRSILLQLVGWFESPHSRHSLEGATLSRIS